VEQLRPAHRYATIWSVPNRKAMAIYPDVIVPSYEPESWNVRVLMAIDSSGSVSDQFLGVARSVANQHLPGTRMRMISFDTQTYEVEPGSLSLKGGGGTDAQAVERYIQKELPGYPDYIFIFTDGYTPQPELQHPARWIWLLPPFGSDSYIPEKCRVYRFDPREL
jgi:predicted metal-dependent peptidase